MESPEPDIVRFLLEKSLKGDTRAQEEIYIRYNKAMFNTCMRMTNNREDAEDLLQDSFVQAFTRLKSFRGESTFGSWLKRIVVNNCINHLKKKKIELIYSEDDEKFESIEEHKQEIHHSWSLDQIRYAIEKLAPGFKVVFSLYMIEGYDHQEISQILNISESTSKSQLNRAKKKLQLLLNEMR